MNTADIFTCIKIRRNARVRKIPTPTPTDHIMICVSTMGVCSARTFRSGSATVTSTPIRKQTGRIKAIFLDFVRRAPIFSPMIIIDVSAPSVNIPMPTMSKIVPTKKEKNISPLSGTTVTDSKKTTAATGSTAPKDSFIFSIRFFCINRLLSSFILPVK